MYIYIYDFCFSFFTFEQMSLLASLSYDIVPINQVRAVCETTLSLSYPMHRTSTLRCTGRERRVASDTPSRRCDAMRCDAKAGRELSSRSYAFSMAKQVLRHGLGADRARCFPPIDTSTITYLYTSRCSHALL